MTENFPEPRRRRAVLAGGALIAAALLAGCNALPERPARATLYDFGGLPAATPAPARPGARGPIALPEVDSSARLDGTQMLYRLQYADGNELRPYALARWSVSPPRLVQQRLREALESGRVVLDSADVASLARGGDARAPAVLQVRLDEFSQVFETPERSSGLVRLQATLTAPGAGGVRVLGQRSFTAQRPAATQDAAGGVKALAAATDAVVAQMLPWLDQVQP